MLDYIKKEDAKYSRFYKKRWGDGPVKMSCEVMASVLKPQYKTILDCGCGLSTLRKYIKCDKYTGIDISSYQINKLNSKNEDKNLKFVRCSLTEPLPFKENEFDCVFSLDVLEHISTKYIDDTLNNMLQVSKEFIFSICLREAKAKDKDGNQVHLTVKPDTWWLNKLNACGYNVEYKRYLNQKKSTMVLKLSKNWR